RRGRIEGRQDCAFQSWGGVADEPKGARDLAPFRPDKVVVSFVPTVGFSSLHANLTRRKHRRSLSPTFQPSVALEVLKTERLRIIALIVVATTLAVGLGTFDLLAPAALSRIWHGRFPVLFMAAGILAFVLFEASILLLIARQIKLGGDVPQLRR